MTYKPAGGTPVMVGADMGEKWWLNVDAGYLRPETIDALMIYNVQKVKARVVLPQHWLVFNQENIKEK